MSNPFEALSEFAHLFHKLDLKKIAALSKEVNLGEMLEGVMSMSPDELNKLGAMLAKNKNRKHKDLPAPNGDFYELNRVLTPAEREIQLRVRKFMQEEVAPIANEYWLKGEFPLQIIPKFAALNICGMTYQGYGCPGQRNVLEGMVAEEIARVDVSTSTFFGVQSGLSMGSIYLCGSEEQKLKYLPQMQKFELLGAFGLTEPEVGSGVAGGLNTSCKRVGDMWTLNGQKKWIGNSTFSAVADFVASTLVTSLFSPAISSIVTPR